VAFPTAIALVFLTTSAIAQTSDSITVTATRTPTRIADTPSSVVVIHEDALAATAALTVDDALRQVPGFSLFRRSGSRTANPTSQGVSLRGVGASGASRALVLDDGIPVNDPFGGWVYWSRIPRAAIDRVEVLRGGASDLYGNAAMAGVVQFFRRPATDTVVADISSGSQESHDASLFAATSKGAWRGSIAADLFTTAGYIIVDPDQRGAVDRNADSRHTDVEGTIERKFEESGRAFFRFAHFAEERNNGTPLQVNDTSMRQFAGGADFGGFSVRAYDLDERYHQTFSAISANRATERLTADQRTPSHGFGGSAQYAHRLNDRVVVLSGVEDHHVSTTGAKQQTTAGYVEGIVAVNGRTSATAGLRYDNTGWSPRLSVLWKANDRLAFTASAYQAFRRPTLNELTRPFRVGNVLTLANPDLQPERLHAFELGARSGPVRLVLFSMTTDDVIANVTRSTTPILITRQRDNAGFSRSRGAEVEAAFRYVTFGYLFADAKLDTGKHTPQVPRQQATMQLTYRRAAVQARWSTMQFDDDLNQFPLRSYFAVDAFASHAIHAGLDATFAIENVFDSRIETAATPVITLGQPRTWRVGLRYKLN
jgi:outer membrane receptor protein involved in Fe transport